MHAKNIHTDTHTNALKKQEFSKSQEWEVPEILKGLNTEASHDGAELLYWASRIMVVNGFIQYHL
jgi:hypothetical protein